MTEHRSGKHLVYRFTFERLGKTLPYHRSRALLAADIIRPKPASIQTGTNH